MRMNLGRWERIGSVAAGAGLLYLEARRPMGRRTRQWIGAGLLARGMSGTCPVKHAVVGDPEARSDTRQRLGGSAGIHVRETLTIRRPVADVYRFWRDLANLAKFLRHIERVDVLDSRRSHWVMRGPGHLRFEWDADILTDETNALISWKSSAPADVVSAGSVIFRPLGSEQTQLSVHFQYAPPGGELGRRVASLFSSDLHAQVREDLQRLRDLLERRDDVGMTVPASTHAVHQPF